MCDTETIVGLADDEALDPNLSDASETLKFEFCFSLQTLSGGVGDSKLKLPTLSPGLFLFVLANLQKNGICALLQLKGCDVLIKHAAGMIDLRRHHFFTINPNLVRVDTPEPHLRCFCIC